MALLDILLAVTGAGAVALLVLRYGFRDSPPVTLAQLRIAAGVVVAIFVLDRLVRLAMARRKLVYLRDSWPDFALMLVGALAAAIGYRYYGKILGAGALYVIITQAYILISLVLRGLGVNLMFAGSGIHPMWLLIGSFAFFCIVGSLLLSLPTATPAEYPGDQKARIGYLDALFTATSATCVTGLVVVDTGGDFTIFGQVVILALIQLGGLGIMVFGTMLAAMVGKALSARGSSALGEMVGTEGIGQLRRTIVFVLFTTFAVEVLGAIMLHPMFAGSPGSDGEILSGAMAWWYSIFHSISSFCNAGFSLYGRNMMAGVGEADWIVPLRSSWRVMGVMAPLIVLGGLGFGVLQDCAVYLRVLLRRGVKLFTAGLRAATHLPRPVLTVHSKIILSTSAALLVLGAVVLLAVEPFGQAEGDWSSMGTGQRIREAIFHSVSARTAGFNTIDMSELSNAGKLWLCGLMVIGGSPAGTAGGMKTATFALLMVTAYCVLRQRSEVEIFRRSIAAELVQKAVALAVLYLLLVIVVTLLLCVTMRGEHFINVLFEACSACGTVGLSTGITGKTEMSKVVTIAAMFIGRLGPITLLLALASKIKKVNYAYPRESIVIG